MILAWILPFLIVLWRPLAAGRGKTLALPDRIDYCSRLRVLSVSLVPEFSMLHSSSSMLRRFLRSVAPVALLLATTAAVVGPGDVVAAAPDLENTLYLDLTHGRVVIQMRPDLAPNHVARIKELARQKFYDGIVFHRVIEGFMAQTGDPTGTGAGGSGKNLKAEFSRERHVRGTLSMARTPDPNSADSQFFIMLGDAPHLDGQYTVWGKVVEGMSFVDRIKKGSQMRNGTVTDPDRIVQMRVAADVVVKGQ
jgi:peptidylprolyl isomerase